MPERRSIRCRLRKSKSSLEESQSDSSEMVDVLFVPQGGMAESVKRSRNEGYYE